PQRPQPAHLQQEVQVAAVGWPLPLPRLAHPQHQLLQRAAVGVDAIRARAPDTPSRPGPAGPRQADGLADGVLGAARALTPGLSVWLPTLRAAWRRVDLVAYVYGASKMLAWGVIGGHVRPR
ncbi:Auxin response factor 19, partial [Frankliniella fusca]